MDCAQRFWNKVDKSGGPDACWEWKAFRTKAGYGQFRAGKKLFSAHRFAWKLVHGPIPDGEGYHGACVLHRCDNPACCNPNHLFLGTHGDNMMDKKEKGRCNSPRGDRHGSRLRPDRRPRGEQNRQAKLTATQVAEIRTSYAAGGVTYGELGRRFGVDKTTIGFVVRGDHWRDVGYVVSCL